MFCPVLQGALCLFDEAFHGRPCEMGLFPGFLLPGQFLPLPVFPCQQPLSSPVLPGVSCGLSQFLFLFLPAL